MCWSLGFPALFPCDCCWRRWRWCVGSQELAEDECFNDEEEDARAPDLQEDGFAEHLEAERLREPHGLDGAQIQPDGRRSLCERMGRTWPAIQSVPTTDARRHDMEMRGSAAGRSHRYHKKYCDRNTQHQSLRRRRNGRLGRGPRTCEVQTLLKVTNANVWTSQAYGRSSAPYRKPSPIERTSWGKKDARG